MHEDDGRDEDGSGATARDRSCFTNYDPQERIICQVGGGIGDSVCHLLIRHSCGCVLDVLLLLFTFVYLSFAWGARKAVPMKIYVGLLVNIGVLLITKYA